MKTRPANTSWGVAVGRRFGVRGVAACVVYIAICLYLYHPYLGGQEPIRYVIPVNSVIGALGCFLLSKRWIGAFVGSLFAGVIYGFCPLAFGLASYHPLAGVPLAFLPWLFCPAAFWRKYTVNRNRWIHTSRFGGTAITVLLCLLPFLAVITYFLLCAHTRIGPVFPLPLEKLHLTNLAGLVTPLAMKPHDFVFSVYHVPLLACLMGLCMLVASKRVGIMVIVGCGLVLAFSRPVFQVSPVVWTLIPMLVASILVGLGMEGLAWAGAADRQWVLFCAAAMAVVAGGCLYLTITQGPLYRLAAAMHTLAVVVACIIYFLERARLRLHAVRWTLLSVAMGLDILICSRQIIDTVRVLG